MARLRPYVWDPGRVSGKLGLGERVRQVENTGLAEGQQEEGLGPWTGRRQDRQAGEPNRLGTNPVLPILYYCNVHQSPQCPLL